MGKERSDQQMVLNPLSPEKRSKSSRRSVLKNIAIVGPTVTGFGQSQTGIAKGISSSGERYPKTEEVHRWTSRFDRNSGWLGGDGIYSLPMNGVDARVPANGTEDTLFVFSDSLIEYGDASEKARGEFTIVHNTLGVMEGTTTRSDAIDFYWREKRSGEPRAVFVPEESDSGDWYWLGDGFVNNALGDRIYIFGLQFCNDPDGAFPRQVETDLLVLLPGSNPPFSHYRRVNTPLLLEKQGDRGRRTFSSCVMPNTEAAGAPNPDGYVYIYGIEELIKPKQLLVARVKPSHFEHFEQWNYWDGELWTSDIKAATGITTRISNELSVTPLPNGEYLLTFQLDTISPYTAIRHGKSPIGPWGPVKKIWYAPVMNVDEDYYAYNAKAHPHLSNGRGSMLMSYNVNTHAFFEDHEKYPEFYYPRFIRHSGL